MDEKKEIESILKRHWEINGIAEVRLIPHGVINSNYFIRSDNASYIFKIYNIRSSEESAFELDIMDYLREKNYPCPATVKNTYGKGLLLFGNRPCALLHYIPGRMLSHPDPETMRRVGRLAGRLHFLLLDFEQKIIRPSWEPEDIKKYISSERENIISKNYPKALEFVSYISGEIQKIKFPEDLPAGMTHQDVKPENIIVGDDGKISIIDFNDCYRGVLLYDCMTMIIWSCFVEGVLQEKLFTAYLEGYDEYRKFTESEKCFLYEALLFRLLRETFVWPMRFSPEVAMTQSGNFLKSYNHMVSNEIRYKKLIGSLL